MQLFSFRRQHGNVQRSTLLRRSTADSDATLIGESDAESIKELKPRRFSFPKLPNRTKNYGVSFTSVLKVSITVSEATNIPYLKGLSGIVLVIWDAVQATEENQDRCIHLQKMIQELVDVVQPHLHDEKPSMVSAKFDYQMNSLSCTLEQLTRKANAYRKRKYLNRFLSSSADKTFFDECEKTIQNALTTFRFRATTAAAAAIRRHEHEESKFHHQALQSLVTPSVLPVQVSPPCSDILTFGLPDTTDELPAAPQIFHGRQSQVSSLTHSLTQDEPAHIVIYGQGGVGKSSLAYSLLHQDVISARYSSKRYCFDCDAMATLPDLYLKMATAFTCGSSRNDVLCALERVREPVLLLLDNLERIWEPLDSTTAVEGFLAELATIPRLSLLVTLRGRQLPLGAIWQPLHLPPLDPTSAKNVFLDISDASDGPEIDQLLRDVADYLPLPITLLAHLAQYEDVPFLLERLAEEGTSMLSIGSGRAKNLDTSIAISLSSPRVMSCPYAIEVLRAFAVTENPISCPTSSSIQNLPMSVRKCISVLSAASLLFEDTQGRLRVPVLVRTYLETH